MLQPFMLLLHLFSCFSLCQYHQLPVEKVERKEVPPEHQALKATFEGLVQRCSAVATDPVSPPFSDLWLFCPHRCLTAASFFWLGKERKSLVPITKLISICLLPLGRRLVHLLGTEMHSLAFIHCFSFPLWNNGSVLLALFSEESRRNNPANSASFFTDLIWR